MRLAIGIAIWTLSAASGPADGGSSAVAVAVAVRGKAMQAGNYCGGAAPSQEILQRARAPRPVTAKFAVRDGTRNSAAAPRATFTPSPDGSFSLELPPGTYCVVRESERRAEDASDAKRMYTDVACMAEWRKGCDATWTVPATSLDGSFTIAQPCFGPCYRGPMPP